MNNDGAMSFKTNSKHCVLYAVRLGFGMMCEGYINIIIIVMSITFITLNKITKLMYAIIELTQTHRTSRLSECKTQKLVSWSL